MAYVQGDAAAGFGIAGDSGLAGPKKRRRKARKKAIRRALRTGASTEGLNQRLVRKLRAKMGRKGRLPGGRESIEAQAGRAAAIRATAERQRAEVEAKAERRRQRIAAGETRKQLKAAAEAAEKDARRRQEDAAIRERQRVAEEFVPDPAAVLLDAEIPTDFGPRDAPPPPDRRLGWTWTGFDWVWSPPLERLPDVFQPRPTNGAGGGGGGGGSPFDFPTREAPVTAGGAPAELPSWLIPAAIGAAMFLL